MARSRRRGRTGASMISHVLHNGEHTHKWGTRRLKCIVTRPDGTRYIQKSEMKVCRCGKTQSPVNTKRVEMNSP